MTVQLCGEHDCCIHHPEHHDPVSGACLYTNPTYGPCSCDATPAATRAALRRVWRWQCDGGPPVEEAHVFDEPCSACDGGDGVHRFGCSNPNKTSVVFYSDEPSQGPSAVEAYCVYDQFSSRTCELGTSGCDIEHEAPQRPRSGGES